MILTVEQQQIATAVERSAVVMDDVQPAWFWKIDERTLDITDPEHCVVGQVWPGQDYTSLVYGLLRPQFDEAFGVTELDGWCAVQDDAAYLGACWEHEIALRLEIDEALQLYLREQGCGDEQPFNDVLVLP